MTSREANRASARASSGVTVEMALLIVDCETV